MNELWFCHFKSKGCNLSLREFMFMLLEFFYCRICSECIHLQALPIYFNLVKQYSVVFTPFKLLGISAFSVRLYHCISFQTMMSIM